MLDLTKIAVVTKPKGLKGEVHVHVLDGFDPAVIQTGPVFIERDGQPIPHLVETVSPGTGSLLVLQVKGITTKEQAEQLRKSALMLQEIDVEEFREEEGMVGYSVFEGQKLLGTVLGVIETSAQELLEIDPGHGEPLLIPFVDAFITTIDDDQKRILVDLPEGLLDIND